MNANPDSEDDKKFSRFAETILSTDDETGKEDAKRTYHNLADPRVVPTTKLEDAKKLLEHLNRASRNLMPGHSGANRALQEHRDSHLMLENNIFVEIPISKLLSRNANTLFGQTYNCRTRTNNDHIELQSSSVH